jgi:hypothetical protein
MCLLYVYLSLLSTPDCILGKLFLPSLISVISNNDISIVVATSKFVNLIVVFLQHIYHLLKIVVDNQLFLTTLQRY